jgi:hypothetical protein
MSSGVRSHLIEPNSSAAPLAASADSSSSSSSFELIQGVLNRKVCPPPAILSHHVTSTPPYTPPTYSPFQFFQPQFTPATIIPKHISSKLKVLNFFGIVCVMYIHSFNEEPVYLEPWTRPKENTFSVALQLFLCGACLRFVVPFFFVVSGFLFFVCKVCFLPLLSVP